MSSGRIFGELLDHDDKDIINAFTHWWVHNLIDCGRQADWLTGVFLWSVHLVPGPSISLPFLPSVPSLPSSLSLSLPSSFLSSSHFLFFCPLYPTVSSSFCVLPGHVKVRSSFVTCSWLPNVLSHTKHTTRGTGEVRAKPSLSPLPQNFFCLK